MNTPPATKAHDAIAPAVPPFMRGGKMLLGYCQVSFRTFSGTHVR